MVKKDSFHDKLAGSSSSELFEPPVKKHQKLSEEPSENFILAALSAAANAVVEEKPDASDSSHGIVARRKR